MVERSRFEIGIAMAVTLLAVAIMVLAGAVILLTIRQNEQQGVARRTRASGQSAYNAMVSNDIDMQKEMSAKLMNSFISSNIRENLRWLTKKVHPAGTPENTAIMHRLADQYRSYGLDVKIDEYKVLLSYPDYSTPNTIEVRNGRQGEWTEVSNGTSQRLGPPEALAEQADEKALIWWNAWAKNGQATGQVVYVNYGRAKDFELLTKAGVSLKGKIALARYGGHIFRGCKVGGAAKLGAIGVIIYNDPLDYGINSNLTANQTFPQAILLPPGAAQRGSLMMGNGDPLTPLYPSKPYTFRTKNESQVRKSYILPNIPVTPIGYRDALTLFRQMDGPEISGDFAHWKGGMDVPYRLNSGNARFRLTVHSKTEQRSIYNVIAFLYGSDEPDSVVLFGNHVDAWTFGSIDPNSGTCTQLEMARVLMSVSNETGWRPRRTIAFCQWDAEEHGLIGSSEWVEEHLKTLQMQAVAMINVDNINGNVSLAVKGAPLLYRAVTAAARLIDHPNPDERKDGRQTLFDSWKHHKPSSPIPDDESLPDIAVPGSGSDYHSFISYVGVPTLDLKMVYVPYSYALYHSIFEVAWTVEHLLDPTFETFKAIAKLWLEIGRSLADNLVIPFNVSDYGIMMNIYVDKLNKTLSKIDYDAAIDDYDTCMSNLKDAVERFRMAADTIQHEIDMANEGIPTNLRRVSMLNRRLMLLERAFIDEFGLYEGQHMHRHVVFSSKGYRGVLFAGVVDPASNWHKNVKKRNKKRANHWATVTRLGISRLQYAIESAIILLRLDGY